MSINYTYEGHMMYLYTLKVQCNIDVTLVEHSCEIYEVFTLFPFTLHYWMSINYTYERYTIYLYKLQVHCSIDAT